MVDHINFYENIKEAELRLKNTVVLYDGDPYYILCIADHKSDGIFRVYLDPVGDLQLNKYGDIPYDSYIESHPQSEWPKIRGDLMDKWMDKNPKSLILRKTMNSPAFNKFRPFPLGNVNIAGKVIYTERQPTRHTQQGLSNSMLCFHTIGLGGESAKKYTPVDYTGAPFRDMVKGVYPTVPECLSNLADPKVTNESVAFHREFAFVRGPIETLFLSYKSDVVGLLPNGDTTRVKLNGKFRHVKEVVEELNLFNEISV